MELPRKHHFKPVFFLNRWVGEDERLCEIKLIRGKLVPRRRHPEGTGYIKDLYRTDGVPEEFSQELETNFMSPLDNDAANALEKIVTDQPLDADARLPKPVAGGPRKPMRCLTENAFHLIVPNDKSRPAGLRSARRL
jgi:hypothetical protein